MINNVLLRISRGFLMIKYIVFISMTFSFLYSQFILPPTDEYLDIRKIKEWSDVELQRESERFWWNNRYDPPNNYIIREETRAGFLRYGSDTRSDEFYTPYREKVIKEELIRRKILVIKTFKPVKPKPPSLYDFYNQVKGMVPDELSYIEFLNKLLIDGKIKVLYDHYISNGREEGNVSLKQFKDKWHLSEDVIKDEIKRLSEEE